MAPTYESAKPASSIPALTGLRGYAALWVVLSHLSYTDALMYPLGMRLHWKYVAGIIQHEYLAVDIFFMLSGFVLLHVHGHEFEQGVTRGPYWRFLLLRLARVYPLHVIGLFLAFIAHQYAPDPVGLSNGATLVLHLALMSSWGLGPRLAWNLPAWSLSSEWFAYLLFPVVALGFAAARTLRARLAAVALLLGIFYLIMFRPDFPFDYSNGPGAQTRVMVGLGLGALLRRLYDEPKLRAFPWHFVLYASLPIAAAAVSDMNGAPLPGSIWSYSMMVVILFSAACGRGWLMAPLSGRVPRYLGEISYAVYIFHYPVLRLLRVAFQPKLEALVLQGSDTEVRVVLGLAALVVLLVAAAMHHLVESPFRRWAKTKILERRQTLPLAEAPEPAAAGVAT